MTTLYLIGGLVASVSMAAWLAYVAGRASGRSQSASIIATLTVERDMALSARDAAERVVNAAVNGPTSLDDVLGRLEKGKG